MSLRTLGLIIWKNLLLRKRQYIITFLEVALPIIGALLTFGLKNLSTPNLKHGSVKSWEPQKTFNKLTEEDLMKPLARGCSLIPYPPPSFSPLIAYAPENPETRRVMELVSAEICDTVNMMGLSITLLPAVDEAKIIEIYEYFASSYDLQSANDFLGAAVVFTGGLDELRPGGGNNGVVSYKLRALKVPPTNVLFPVRLAEDGVSTVHTGDSRTEHDLYGQPGPIERNAKAYVNSGFIGLQLAIDKVLAKQLTNQDLTYNVSLQPFPYPPYPVAKEYSEYSIYNGEKQGIFFLPNFYLSITWGLCFMIPSITRNVVGEKQSGIQELLRLTGVSGWIQWVGWLIHVVTPHLFTVTVLTIIACTPIMSPNFDDTPYTFSDGSLIWTIIFISVLANAALCFFVCSLFQNPVVATTVAIIVYVVTLIVGSTYNRSLNFGIFTSDWRIGLSVFPNFALAVLLYNAYNLEWAKLDESDMFAGARWSNLEVKVKALEEYYGQKHLDYPVSNLHVLLMMLGDILLYTLLALYFESIIPSEHGVKRPWYLFEFGGRRHLYPVGAYQVAPMMSADPIKSEVLSGADSAVHTQEVEESNDVGGVKGVKGFEPEPLDAPVGIDIRGLRKRFGRKTAVNGVSLRMFSGDIFALLGHNGAGKTTLISMLTGFFAPTAGTAVINGYDIQKDLEKVRQSMGLCPQHNMLFENLGVAEQLHLFGMLRGLSWKQAKAESSMLLSKMAFSEKASVAAKNLSGGQKRKLCLAIALIGGTKIVVLDEPTSGMDPQARREIWDILLQLRGERTILLTTHFMEEADVLGDRIGIMANGMVQCCGTTAFLKRHYGAGYTLKLTLYGGEGNTTQNSDEAKEILEVVQKHVSDATFKAQARLDRGSNEVFLTLPSETATTAALTEMFVELTARKEKLGINTIGLQQTTMDEVFLRVGELVEEEKYGIPEHSTEDATFERAPKARGSRFGGQFMSLIMKKLTWAIRKWIMLAFVTVLPFGLFMMVVHIGIHYSELIPENEWFYGKGRMGMKRIYPDPLLLSLTKYSNPITLYPEKHHLGLPKLLGDSGKKVTSSVHDALIEAGTEDRIKYKRNYIVAVRVKPKNFIAMFNMYPFHAAPIAINIATNTLLKELNEKYRIDVTTHPLTVYSNDRHSSDRYPNDRYPNDGYPNDDQSPFSRKNGPGPPVPAGPPVIAEPATPGPGPPGPQEPQTPGPPGPQEPQTPGPRPQYKPSIVRKYYNKMEVVPLLVGPIIPLAFVILVTYFVVNPINEKNCKVKQLQTMTGINPLVYWGASFAWDYFLYLLLVFAMFIYLLIFDIGFGYEILTWGYGWLVFVSILIIHGVPGILFSYLISFWSSTVAGGFSLVMLIHLLTGICMGALLLVKDKEEASILAWICGAIGRLFPVYSFVRAMWNYGDIAVHNSRCRLLYVPVDKCEEDRFPPVSYITWTKEEDRDRFYDNDYDDFGRMRSKPIYPSIGQDIFFMVLIGFLYFGLLVMIEWGICRKICSTKESKNAFPPNINDDDVLNEMERVNMLISNGQVETECLIVQNLCKSFGAFAAVSQLHFGVHYGECFGLLGVNGAGKTTAFRMITGDEVPSLGTAYGFGTSLGKDHRRFLSNIGYCPQFDAILPNFTGKEMLQLFAGLRGVPFKLRGQEATRWLNRMGLLESANAKCGRYSGGMKRRLSTAMAMIGDPALVLLDEPTSGVDPVSRRQFWKILDKLRESGQSIILTSHSMDECEALCSRLGIMVNGQFQCFGGVQHLKSKFAQGYSLTLKLKPDLPFETEEVKAQLGRFEEAISQRFQPCELKDKHQNLLQYHLNNPSISWDVLFKTMEGLKAEFVDLIEDYSVNETSLEEVFLAFARAQYPERKANVSLCMQICTCRC